MFVFYTTLISTFIFAWLSRIMEEYGYKDIAKFCIFIVAVIIIIVSGLRYTIGDTSAYMHSYELLREKTFADFSIKEGFNIFQIFLHQISDDPQLMIFITSLVTQGTIIYSLYKYRNYIELEVYMYITCGLFLVTMNGIRQAFVGALLFASTRLISNGKFIPYIIIVVILSTMHSSAIIMIPLYFIVKKEAWSKTTMIVIFTALVVFIFFNELMPSFFDLLGENSTYAVYEETMSQEGVGSSFTRVLVNAVPVILAYLNRDQLKEEWRESDIFVNMSIINLIFITFALYNWIFARFQIYFQFYNIVLLPYIIKNCIKRKEDKRLIYYLFLILYFIFFYYEQVIGGVGLGYKSNYFNF